MALHLYIGNRLETLADHLAGVLQQAPALPLAPEHIVVQSRAMEHWLSIEIARRTGIAANLAFCFPNALLYRLMQLVMPDLPDVSPFERSVLSWSIMGLLPGYAEQPGFDSVRGYLDGEHDLKLFQLAERIADAFDQYLIYRPEMIQSWEQSRPAPRRDTEETWQAELWRGLVSRFGGRHRLRLMQEFLQLIAADSTCAARLPGRVCIFGLPYLPPVHLDFFAALARVIDVHLFLSNPCREFWGDLLSRRDAARIAARRGSAGLSADPGNSLLASLGMRGREFFDLIQEYEAFSHDCFDDIDQQSLLGCIQSDILQLRERGAGQEKKTIVAREDASIQMHACHSPMREVEVLYDRLLAMFADDPQLRPHDIIVMCPDPETYAPLIEALFSSPEQDGLAIPFSIADRGPLPAGTISTALLQLCDLAGSRCAASQVVALLDCPAIRRRFSLTEPDLDLIERWLAETRICWGIDEQSRAAAGVPAYSQNTWKAGLERLLLGYALPGGGERLFAGILPYDDLEADSARTLGGLAEFAQSLFALLSVLAQPRTLGEWSRVLLDLLDSLFLPDQDEQNLLQSVRQVCAALGQRQELSGFGQPVSLEVIRAYLRKALSQQSSSAGFLRGAMTVCALQPLRSIPCPVVCLIGMNSTTFPRHSYPPGFNLAARHPRPSDHSVKKDDRYLFLETLLSARTALYISYTGQSIRDNSLMPPSVVVSELIDYIEQGFRLADGSLRDHILRQHHLQAFNPAYFQDGDRLQSFSAENCRCAQVHAGPPAEPAAFLGQALEDPEETFQTLDLQGLSGFFGNPARYLLQKRLGLYIQAREMRLEDSENLTLGPLDQYQVAQDLLEQRLAGYPPEALYDLLRARAVLPPGAVGRCHYARLDQEVCVFIEAVSRYAPERSRLSRSIDLALDRLRISGKIDHLYGAHLVRYRCAVLKPKDFLTLWLEHVVLQADQHQAAAFLIGLKDNKDRDQPEVWEYGPLAGARDILGNLLSLYWQGLHAPLPLFPAASYAFAEAVLKRTLSEEEALLKAREAFLGTGYGPGGDLDDPYIRLCFSRGEALDGQFRQCALAVYGPLFSNRQQPSLTQA